MKMTFEFDLYQTFKQHGMDTHKNGNKEKMPILKKAFLYITCKLYEKMAKWKFEYKKHKRMNP